VLLQCSDQLQILSAKLQGITANESSENSESANQSCNGNVGAVTAVRPQIRTSLSPPSGINQSIIGQTVEPPKPQENKHVENSSVEITRETVTEDLSVDCITFFETIAVKFAKCFNAVNLAFFRPDVPADAKDFKTYNSKFGPVLERRGIASRYKKWCLENGQTDDDHDDENKENFATDMVRSKKDSIGKKSLKRKLNQGLALDDIEQHCPGLSMALALDFTRYTATVCPSPTQLKGHLSKKQPNLLNQCKTLSQWFEDFRTQYAGEEEAGGRKYRQRKRLRSASPEKEAMGQCLLGEYKLSMIYIC
jgi:hypothetical protein